MDAAPTMEVALPTPIPAAAPRAVITEPVQNRKRFDYKKVPAFDSNKMEWRDFLGIFEMAARWNEWTDTQKAQQLAMSMTGSAQKYVLRLPAATLESYPDLVAAVTRRYDPEEGEAANLADFQNRKRHDKESVEDYGQALQSLAGKAFPETPEQALERMVIFQFTAGMEEEDLRRHIHFGRAKTMDKAISLAVEWESFSNKKKDNDKDKADTPVKQKVASVEASPIADQMEVLLAKLDRIGEGWRGRPRADKSRVTCYGCGALGHFRRECPHEQNPQGRRPRAPAQGAPPVQAAPTIGIVTKKDGTPRVCIDFRKVNNVTRKDAFPLPRMDDCLDALAGSKLFSTLDLASGYWQIPVAEEDRDKTAFNTRNGLHRFRVMPFGLATAPATFERLMELVLKGLTFDRCLVYLDDVIVFGRTFEEALQNLDRVFERIEQASLLLKPSKCRLFKTSVDFLGHVVSADGIICDPKKISAVQNWAAPSSVKEVRSFVGFASYYRKFIPGFATVAGPLHALMGKVKFEWSNACQEAFDKLRSLLMSTPVLAYPQEGQTFYLDTDASNVGTGAVLSQVHDGSEHPVAYASRALSTSQRNYCTTMRELLAVVQYTNHFRHFLLGNKFILRTDHASLVWLTNFKEPEGMLARWLAALAVFDFEIQHRPGKKHGNADGLSRRKCARSQCPDCRPTSDDEIAAHLSDTGPSNESENRPKVDEHSELDDIDREQSEPGSWLQGWTLEELKAAQDEDKNIAKFTAWKLSRLPCPERAAAGICGREGLWFYACYDMLEVHNGLLYVADTKREVKSSTVLRLVAPLPIRRQLFKQIHQTRTGGHQGINNTIAVVNRHFYWPGQYADVRRWCQQCEGCARAKTGESGHRAKLVQDIPGMPMERMAVDLMGPLPKTENGNLYIAVVVDYFTKWAEAFALPNKQSQTVAEALVTGVICRLGAPHRLHSDQGGEFESNLWAEVCELLDVEKTRTSPYRPQSDGLVERLNRTIKKMLKVFVNDNRDDWDDHLPYIMMAYRATPQASTQCSPNLLMYGREVNLPVEVMAPPPPSQAFTCPNEYVEWIRAVLEQAFQFARHHLAASAERQKRCYDNRSNPRNFQAGHWVWYLYKPYCRLKFKCPWIGPCLVLRQLGRVNVEIQASPEDKPKVVHVDYLKPYWAEDKVPERWVPLPEEATREWPPEDPGAWDEDPDSAEKEDEAPRPASPEAEEPVEAEDEIALPLKDVRPEARRRVRKPARYQDYVMT